ncbi:AGL293Cp [Eremothecium gossypii ATCC 10895]|uniref:AGL293Cp n=1 Tax=Eremothecium gossypii (strain ATCC 10895 / CBS 109.51 / FGSC 9923 / NRRL Y-1056) TaxID=284811 RepID=Q751J9_EREGS|nr:AGL293Cp [Eremothecium gossypii ATCC 10895]AAS54198.1 AGL293Cp [Eremothecium gossypii ATCC 10895]
MSFSFKKALKLTGMEQGDDSTAAEERPRYGTYIAINEYSKRMEDELDMKPGDKIEVITDDQEYNDGWYFGRNLRTGEEGLYPKLFTQELSVERTPSLMRAKSTRRAHSPMSSAPASRNDSNSELPGHMVETAATIRFPPKLPGEGRAISVKSTMSDIDKALEELRGESMGALHFADDVSEVSKPPTSGNTTLNYANSSFPTSNDTSTSNNGHPDEQELNPADAELWTPEQVTAYLLSTGFDEESSNKFQEHKISGAILLELELAHLKELEINSFGTRFEIFKEIEAIKETVAKASTSQTKANGEGQKTGGQLMPAAPVSQDHALAGQNLRQNIKDAASLGKAVPQQVLYQAPSSPELAIYSGTPTDDTFMSPRKAPEPPSYPSPVQPPKSPSVTLLRHISNSSSLLQNQARNQHITIYEHGPQTLNSPASYTSSRKQSIPQVFMQPAVDEQPDGPDLGNPYSNPGISPMQRTFERAIPEESIRARHKKTKSGGSFVELFNRISMLSSPNDYEGLGAQDSLAVPAPTGRPSSSIYGHSRNVSASTNKRASIAGEFEHKHRRNSSILSFLNREKDVVAPQAKPELVKHGSLSSLRIDTTRNAHIDDANPVIATQQTPASRLSEFYSPGRVSQDVAQTADGSSDIDFRASSERRSTGLKEPRSPIGAFFDARDDLSSNNSATAIDKNAKNSSKRTLGDAVKGKRRGNNVKPISKKQTSAFMEGIRNVTVNDAVQDAACSGWMSKKGAGTMGVWKNRFFVLHGTRLSYFANTTDNRERGLIDITSHRVLPAKEDDKFVALYAASIGRGRYCFKLVPPAPGSKKGLTFTQPRVHYFAVETREEMRTWMAALMKATIDIDTSVPVISSCATPTVSLSRAQEMFAQAMEETSKRDEMLNQADSAEVYWDQHHRNGGEETLNVSKSMTSIPLQAQNSLIKSAVHSQATAIPDSPASNATKSSNYGFSFENPNANGNANEYYGLDPKYMGEKI